MNDDTERGCIWAEYWVRCGVCQRKEPLHESHRLSAPDVARRFGWRWRASRGWMCADCHAKPLQRRRTEQQYEALTLERYKRVLHLREEGKTWNEIGTELGLSRSRASQIWHQARRWQVLQAGG